MKTKNYIVSVIQRNEVTKNLENNHLMSPRSFATLWMTRAGATAIRKASVLCTLCAVLLLASCTEDDLVTQTIPLAPQGMKTVTVDFQLTEGKPGFEVQSTETRGISNSSPESGEVALVPEGYVMTATDRPLSPADSSPNLEEQLSYSATRATTASWAEGDELLMKVTVKGFDDTDGYAVYESYMMLAYDSDGRWDMLEDKSTTVTENSPVANPDYVMLAQTTDIDLTQPLSIKVPEDMSLDMTIVSVTYAPELEWDITPDANGAVTDVNLKLKATATTTAPECWKFSGGEWTNDQARLRVHTGVAGDVVTLTSEKFYPNSIGKSADGIYTATTDADGDAYFYGKAGTIDESDEITATTSGFNLSLTAVTVGDGDAAFTCPIAPVTLLEASTLVPVQLVEGKSYRLDATEKRTAATNTIAVIDGTWGDEDLQTAIIDAIAAGKTTLYVTGEPVGDIGFAISYSGAEDGTIDLILADATAIGDNDFYRCTALKSVSAPKATTIGEGAFHDCSALASVSLPDVTEIGKYAFAGCTSLTSVSLPTAETIGDNAFDGTSLTSVSLPEAETIGVGAFASTSLTSVSLPAATTIGDGAFFDCEALASVELPEATTIGKQAFMQCNALASVSAPKATSIGDVAFWSCTSLTSVSLPDATTIGHEAFNGCDALTSVSLPAAIAIGMNAFFGCAALTSVSLPEATMIGDYAFQNCAALKSLTFGSVIETVGTDAFLYVPTENCALTLNSGQLSSTDLKPSGNTWAGETWASIRYVDDEGNAVIDGAATDADAVTAQISDALDAGQSTIYVAGTTLESAVKSAIKAQADGSIDLVLLDATSIGFNAFYNYIALKSVSAPKATSIGNYAFRYCTALTSVSLPAATSIGDCAFLNCTALTSLTFGTVTSVSGIAFENASTETCDLTLGTGTTDGDLDVENKKWAGEIWKSITLVNSN